MLNILFGPSEKNCEGVSRRNFLQVGALGFGGLTLPGLLASRAAAVQANRPTRDTSVVWVWLNGGPTHIETFDPKMTAPSEFRSVTGEVQTVLPGVTLGSNFTQLAQIADKMAFVRSFTSGSNSHNQAAYRVVTGYSKDRERPSLGSITSRVRGANHSVTGMPTYVGMGRIGFNADAPLIPGPAWLGQAYGPFNPSGPARDDMNLTTEVSRLEDRRSLLSNFDQTRRDIDASGEMDAMDGFGQQAMNLLLGDARDAFDLDKEEPRTRNRYGDGLGASLLTARRLCEAGCGFVTVSLQGWDMHGNIARGMNSRGPQVDRAVSAFVEDIYQRGLDENILLVVTGEFGRTPRVNRRAGRDHWGTLSTLALSGGGLNVGRTVGESSSKAERPIADRVTVQDLMATVFHVLGIDPHLHFNDPSGRPIPMLESGQPIPGLV